MNLFANCNQQIKFRINRTWKIQTKITKVIQTKHQHYYMKIVQLDVEMYYKTKSICTQTMNMKDKHTKLKTKMQNLGQLEQFLLFLFFNTSITYKTNIIYNDNTNDYPTMYKNVSMRIIIFFV
jgi:hypothetical protein